MSRHEIENPIVLEPVPHTLPERPEDPYQEKPRITGGWIHSDWAAALVKPIVETFQPAPMVLDKGYLSPHRRKTLKKSKGGVRHE